MDNFTLRRRLYEMGEMHLPNAHSRECRLCQTHWPCETSTLLEVIDRLIGTAISGGPVDLD